MDASEPFTVTDWTTIPEIAYPGESGIAFWRTLQVADARIRMVHYSPGYVADHWCDRGHIVLVLSGELMTELNDGIVHRLSAGMSYSVAARRAPHRSRSVHGAVLFIVD
jgi:quercetin dioxygenase-like cupin family protein